MNNAEGFRQKAAESVSQALDARASGDLMSSGGNYSKAANWYKLAKDAPAAAEAFTTAAEVYGSAGMKLDAADSYKDAASVYRGIDQTLALKTANLAVDHYLADSNFTPAAKTQKFIAELHEMAESYHDEVEALIKAAGLYEASNCPSNGMTCSLKAADLLAVKLQNYTRAASIYHDCVYAVKGNLLYRRTSTLALNRAAVCLVADDLNDFTNARFMIEQTYARDFPAWYGWPSVFKRLLDVLEKKDAAAFESEVQPSVDQNDSVVVHVLNQILRSLVTVDSVDTPSAANNVIVNQ